MAPLYIGKSAQESWTNFLLITAAALSKVHPLMPPVGSCATAAKQQQVETVVNFLVRVALFAMTNIKDNTLSHLSRQCLRLLEKALSLWPDTPIKYT